MKKWYACALLIVIMAAINITGCATHRELLEPTGVFGEHYLRVFPSESSINGSFEGGFFFGCGSASGKVSTEKSIRFTWSPKPDVYVVTLIPEKKIRMVRDSTKIVPTVEFKFREYWLDSWLLAGISSDMLENVNLLFDDENFQVFIVRISPETLKRETCLPQTFSPQT
ncbi:MAG: hypothetical protein WCV50_02235 [Patescibacteria group bacterium]|jgi:hypothetical protein